MKTALACPVCGHTHWRPTGAGPGAGTSTESTFRCESCSTLLRVPDEAGAEDRTPSSPPSRSPSGASVADRVAPGSASPAGAAGAPRPHLVWPLRALVWMIALPVGLATTGLLLSTIGLLGAGDLVDLFLGAGLGRFAWLLLLVPLWAALTAVLAHLSIETLGRWARGRDQRRGSQRTRP